MEPGTSLRGAPRHVAFTRWDQGGQHAGCVCPCARVRTHAASMPQARCVPALGKGLGARQGGDGGGQGEATGAAAGTRRQGAAAGGGRSTGIEARAQPTGI